MKHSLRLDKLPPYLFAEMDRKVNELRAKGVKVISLGIGDPDMPTPDSIIEELNKQAFNKANHQYPSYEGLLAFRQVASDYLRDRYGVVTEPHEILTLIGSKEGIAHLPFAMLNHDDTAIIPSPAYPVYYNSTVLADGTPYVIPLLKENGFLPRLEDIPDDVANKARLFFINYPNNPTGAFADAGFKRDIIRFCKQYDILLCSDLAYGEVYFEEKPFSFLSEDGDNANVIEFHSLSKPFNMTGWRIGFAAGDKLAIEALGRLKTNIDSGVFQAIQYAGIHALTHELEHPRRISIIYKKRMEAIIEGFKQIGIDLEMPQGTFYLWGRVPQGYSSISFADEVLSRYAIVITPGSGFGEYGEGFIRISATVDDALLEEALNRLR